MIQANAQRVNQLDEIQRCLETYHRPGDVFEVRAVDVPSGRYKNIVSGWFNDFSAAAAAVAMVDARGAAGVYATINPCDFALLARRNNRVEDRPKETTKDEHITRRRWLPIDIDPIRPAGIMATEGERQAAREMAAAVEDLLRGEGFSFPLIADSGNGVYLAWPTDMPNDDTHRMLLESFYAALIAAVPSAGASIDKTVFNASRILRVGGTWNRKGDGTPDRPHRVCHYREPIDDCPVDLVQVETIRAFVEKYAPRKEQAKSGGNGQYHDRLDVARYLRGYGVSFTEKDSPKGRKYIVRCPFNEDHGTRGESAVMQESDGKLSYVCFHNGCSGRRWADYRDAIGKPLDDHYDPPRQRVDTSKITGKSKPTKDNEGQGEAAPTFVTRRYEEIEVEQVKWLWQNRFALGKLSLVAGVPGVGKTFLLCDMSARCTRGHRFADGSQAPLCDVLIMTAEDGPEDTIKPRLIAHGADCARVHHFDRVDVSGKDAYFTMTAYLDVFKKWLQDHPAVKLIVFDPIPAFLGDGVDSHKNAEVRAALGPLCKLAEELGVAIVGITHLSKSEAKAINRVIGSIAFVGAARSCWLVDWDPETDGRRLFLPIKNNLAHADGLAYTITDGTICWESDPVTITADELSDSHHTTPRDEAEDWLRQALEDGRVASAKLTAEANREGISVRTLNRAKKKLGVQSARDGSTWYWTLPDEPDLSEIICPTDVEKAQRHDFGEYNG